MQVLEITRMVLGAEHLTTSITAWNLFITLHEIGDTDEATTILEKHLVWLLGKNPEYLGADQGIDRPEV